MSYKDATISDAERCKKLYSYNTVQEIYACCGYNKKYGRFSDCLNDNEIRELAGKALQEISLALQREFGYSKSEMDSWNEKAALDLQKLLTGEKLDTVGHNLEENLRKDGILTGPVLLCKKNGILPYYLAKVIAFSFLYAGEQDGTACPIKRFMSDSGIKQAIIKYCELDMEPEMAQLIFEHYNKISAGNGFAEDYKRVDFVKRAFELGFNYEATYRGCPQCTLAAFFDLTGKEDKMLFQVASGFSGGMALCGDGPCGGYSGGTMLIGSYVGRRMDFIPIDGDREAQHKGFEMSQKLHDKFVETYGSVICADIHRGIFGRAYCLRDDSVHNDFDAAGAHKYKCTAVVATACMWLAEILMDEGFIETEELTPIDN